MNFRKLVIKIAGIALTLTLAVFVIGCSPDSPSGESRPAYYDFRTSTSDGGTGKFYMGREIADVMQSEHSVTWWERPTRDTEELPSRLLQVLELTQSAVVADIGAGTGFLTFRLARMVPS